MIEQLKALNRFQRTVRTVKHTHTPKTPDSCEIPVTHPELLSTLVLRELQDAHNPEHVEESTDEFADLTICDQDQNADYDCEMHTDDAAKWLRMADLYPS